MHKPYVYLYVSSVLLLLLGFLLMAMDLVVKAQGAGDVSLVSLMDWRAPAVQAGGLLSLFGLYHFILGVKVDSAYRNEESAKVTPDFLNSNAI